MKHIFLLSFLLALKLPFASGQTDLIPAEKFLLDLFKRDTLTSTTIYLPDGIDFDIQWRGQTNLIAAFDKSSKYFMVQGTHRVYTLNSSPSKNEVALTRIDSSDFYGDNYNCMAFLHRDTLFEYGGYGFWKYRDFFTRYRPLSGDWEFVQGGNSLENARTVSWLDRDHHQFYTAGRFSLNPFVSFNPVYEDSVHKYDLNTRKWTLMGKLAYEPLQAYREWVLINIWSTPFGTGLALPNNLFVVLDFRNNRVIPLKKDMEEVLNSMRDISNRSLQNGRSFWFYLKDSLYHLTFNEKDFKINHTRFDSTALDYQHSKPLYIPAKAQKFALTPNSLTSVNFYYGMAFLLAGLGLGWWLSRRKFAWSSTEKMTGPVILEQEPGPFIATGDFRSSLNSVELEFLNELVRYTREGKKMPTSVINKLLGVSGKDPEIQKARRSNIITRINKLYSGMAGKHITLIGRMRDPYDKRSYLYFIEAGYLSSLQELLKQNGQDLL